MVTKAVRAAKAARERKRSEMMYSSTVERAQANKAKLHITLEEFIAAHGDYSTVIPWSCRYGQLHQTVPYSVGKCLKHKNSYDTYYKLSKSLEEQDCRLETTYDDFMRHGGIIKMDVDWICVAGQRHTTTGQKAGICVRHVHQAEQYKRYVEVLEAELWSMLSLIVDYETVATLMRVMCNRGHPQMKSFDNFNHGHRCRTCVNNGKKADKEVVKQDYIDAGFTAPLDCEFGDDWNGHKAVNTHCHCGLPTTLSYSNLLKGTVGCKNCGPRSRRTPWRIIVAAFEEEGNVLKTIENDYDNEDSTLEFTCPEGHETRTTWRLYHRGHRCRDCVPERRKKTCLKTYGVENPFQSEAIKEKIRATHMVRRGVPHHMKDARVIAARVKNRQGAMKIEFPSGRTAFCEGNEADAIDWCLEHFDEDDILVSSDVIRAIEYFFPDEDGNMISHHYHCDISVVSEDLYVEAKSRMSATNPKEVEINQAKYMAVAQAGYDMLVLTFNDNGELIDETLYGCDWE